MSRSIPSSLILGLALVTGLGLLGHLSGQSLLAFKSMERTVTVKGLAEQEVVADRVIWPIAFSEVDNDLTQLYQQLEQSSALIRGFLLEQKIPADSISVAMPAITDRSAQQYGSERPAEFRYLGQQTVTVYRTDIEGVRRAMVAIRQLGQEGLVLSAQGYGQEIEFLLTDLNEYKPAMIEAATENARQVAEKFARDSHSQLGKIRRASQGQFSIRSRDKNNPHIKKIRVVSTIEYYLSD